MTINKRFECSYVSHLLSYEINFRQSMIDDQLKSSKIVKKVDCSTMPIHNINQRILKLKVLVIVGNGL